MYTMQHILYKNKKLKMETWKGNESDHIQAFAWLSYSNYLLLFGIYSKRNRY